MTVAFRRWAERRKARRLLVLRANGYLYARRVLACQGRAAIPALECEADCCFDRNAFDDGMVEAIRDYEWQVTP